MNLPDQGMSLTRPAFWVRFSVAALIGVAVMHVVEFHLELGFSGRVNGRVQAMAYMIEHCPLRGSLAILAGAASIVAMVTIMTMRAQVGRLRALEGTLEAGRESRPRSCTTWTLSWTRLLLILPALTLIQWALFSFALHLVPMDYVMQMHGGHMLMAMTPPVPVLPLSLAVASLASLVLGRLETRLAALESAIAECLRALFGQVISSPPPVCPAVVRITALRFGPSLFSRPPPRSLLPGLS